MPGKRCFPAQCQEVPVIVSVIFNRRKKRQADMDVRKGVKREKDGLVVGVGKITGSLDLCRPCGDGQVRILPGHLDVAEPKRKEGVGVRPE